MGRSFVGMLLATTSVLLLQIQAVVGVEPRQFPGPPTTGSFNTTDFPLNTTFSVPAPTETVSTLAFDARISGTAFPTHFSNHPDYPGPNSHVLIYSETDGLRSFAIATIVLLIINALLLISLIAFIALIYFKRLPLSHGSRSDSPPSSSSGTRTDSASEVGTISMQSRGTLATPSIDGTVQRALKGRTIPSHHYPTRSWDRVPTIASTSTESERRRRKRPASSTVEGYVPVRPNDIGLGSSEGSYPTQSRSSGGYGDGGSSVSIIGSKEDGLDPFRDSSITSGSVESGYTGTSDGTEQRRGGIGGRY
ncbi:hypothetical protein EST38_g4058 [Candolleomyces aberdarensis]|uniref:Uncharacterized protein n=1 Tax=Candolleomyces aberdarensis TaxID=2316362 RepID=A0A4Q2DQR6_9AGAR|nr:hypothetical protein EST38_g4058 [Candolleomyces aberdarensis]